MRRSVRCGRERLSTEPTLDMIVVADTAPIKTLVLIAQIDLLTRLYTRIVIPPAVMAELKHPLAPKPVRTWVDSAPGWLEVLSPKSSLILAQLDPGENEAIAPAIEVHAEVLLIDEQAGRRVALDRGLWSMLSRMSRRCLRILKRQERPLAGPGSLPFLSAIRARTDRLLLRANR